MTELCYRNCINYLVFIFSLLLQSEIVIMFYHINVSNVVALFFNLHVVTNVIQYFVHPNNQYSWIKEYIFKILIQFSFIKAKILFFFFFHSSFSFILKAVLTFIGFQFLTNYDLHTKDSGIVVQQFFPSMACGILYAVLFV